MNDIEKLLALEDIKALKARYFRYVDTKDWDGYESLFAPDAQIDLSDDMPGDFIIGPANIRRRASEPLTGCVSIHHGHCPEIEFTSDTTARGIWAMEDMLRWQEDNALVPIKSLHGYGHYFETYERIAGRWVIKTMKLKRLRVDVEPKA